MWNIAYAGFPVRLPAAQAPFGSFFIVSFFSAKKSTAKEKHTTAPKKRTIIQTQIVSPNRKKRQKIGVLAFQ